MRSAYSPRFLLYDCAQKNSIPISAKSLGAAASSTSDPDANPWYATSKNAT